MNFLQFLWSFNSQIELNFLITFHVMLRHLAIVLQLEPKIGQYSAENATLVKLKKKIKTRLQLSNHI